MNCNLWSALAIIALCCGCNDEPTRARIDLGQQEQQPVIVRLEELDYHDPVIRKRVHCIDEMARLIADPKSHHLAWHVNPRGPQTNSAGKTAIGYHAMWCLQSDRANHLCTDHTQRPVHCISLRATAHPENARKLLGLHLNVSWHPVEAGWGVRMSYDINKAYSESAAVTEKIGITFYYQEDKRDAGSDAVLAIPGGGIRLVKHFDQLEYVIAAPANSGAGSNDDRRFLASAEWLRDFGLAEIDRVEPLIRDQIISGVAVRSVTDHSKIEERITGGTDGGDPKTLQPFHPTFEPPLQPEYELNEEQKQEILAEAMRELDRRRSLLRDHYLEMYAATQKAFPLNQCLQLQPEK